MNKRKKIKLSQRGAVSVILAVLLMSELLVIGLGMSILIVQQIRMSSQTGLSVVAFYAADAGAEKCLYQARNMTGTECGTPGGGSIVNESIGTGVYTANYTAVFNGSDNLTSIGQLRGVSRKLELTW
jgi:uncharacterized protein (UPF0333 family)|tara:strand:- start:3661 stop:4041 length:381 start_codon:yes stop_codon:yes gene_type:complete